MARLEGFEPPTNRIGTCYSIQLSYRRVRKCLRGYILRTGPAFAKQIIGTPGSPPHIGLAALVADGATNGHKLS